MALVSTLSSVAVFVATSTVGGMVALGVAAILVGGMLIAVNH